MTQDKVKNETLVRRAANASTNALSKVGSFVKGVFSTSFWIYVIVIGNIVFFAANIFKPVGVFIEQSYTFSQSSRELMNTIEALEKKTGVSMEDWVDGASRNFLSLKSDVANTNARTEKIEAALFDPVIYFWNHGIPENEPDCLGVVETMFRDNDAVAISSGERMRAATFVDAAGFKVKFSAMCLGQFVGIFGTSYNSKGTQEVFSDLTSSLIKKWPEPDITKAIDD